MICVAQIVSYILHDSQEPTWSHSRQFKSCSQILLFWDHCDQGDQGLITVNRWTNYRIAKMNASIGMSEVKCFIQRNRRRSKIQASNISIVKNQLSLFLEKRFHVRAAKQNVFKTRNGVQGLYSCCKFVRLFVVTTITVTITVHNFLFFDLLVLSTRKMRLALLLGRRFR